MKKLKSFGVAAVAALLLTSCLDGSREDTIGGCGVIDLSMDAFANVAYLNDYTQVYAPQFKDLNSGDCIIFNATLNYDDPANNGSKKYWTVSNAIFNKVDSRGYLNSTVDTANIRMNEIPAADAGLLSYVVKNYIFLYSSHEKAPSDQKNIYSLEYNPSIEPSTVDGKRVYDFFLRVVKESDGTGASGLNLFNYAINTGGQIKNLESKEIAAGKEQLNIRINYLKSYNEETKVASWGRSQVYSIALQKETNK